MYHDSDDEPLSGDEDESRSAAPPKRRRVSPDTGRATVNIDGGGGSSERPVRGGRKSSPAEGRGRGKASDFRGFDVRPVIVVDYDLTLVDRSSRPFPGAHAFIERLRGYNGGRNQLVLYSHGSPAYIDAGLDSHFGRERKYFDEIISDSSARENKPVTHVRRVIKSLDSLVGPYVIVDDMRSNLDDDQYDVVVDVTRMTRYGEGGRAVSVDYDSVLCTIDRGVRAFLATKRRAARQ